VACGCGLDEEITIERQETGKDAFPTSSTEVRWANDLADEAGAGANRKVLDEIGVISGFKSSVPGGIAAAMVYSAGFRVSVFCR